MAIDVAHRPPPATTLLPGAAVGGAALVGAIAVVSPLAAAGLVLGGLFVVAALRDLAAGVALFTLLTFFEVIPGVASSGVTFVKLAAGALVAIWALHLATHRDLPFLPRDRPFVAAAAGGLCAWALLSTLWAVDADVGLSSALRLAQGPLLVLVVYSAIREPRHLRWVAAAYVAGACATAAYGLASGSAGSVDETRLAGGIGNPNELARLLLPALMLSAFALGGARGLKRMGLVAVAVATVVALFLTGSRGGLVALAVAVVVGVVVAGPLRARAVAMVLALTAVGLVWFGLFAPPETVDHVTNFTQGGGTGRTDLWSVAGEVVRDHPLAGVGAGNFTVVEPQYAFGDVNLPRIDLVFDQRKVVHNTYLHVLSELGLVGFVLFCALLAAGFVAAVRAIRGFRRGPWDVELLARGFAAAFGGVLAGYLFASAQYEKQLWLLLGLAFALPSVARALANADEGGPYAPAVLGADGGATDDEDGLAAERRFRRRDAALTAREQRLRTREKALQAAEDELRAALRERERENAELRERIASLEARVARGPGRKGA
jgi:O-antigen ligase